MTNKVSSHVLSDTAVGAGTYGGTTQHAVFTVDSQGRLTYAANATPSIATSQLTGTIGPSQVAAGTYAINVSGSSGSTTGNAGTVTNGVYSVGNQTITGTKTFNSKIVGSISGNADGNAGTVTNGVYTEGNQTINGIKTFSSKITGSISGNADGNAGSVTNGVYTNGSYADPAWITSLSKSKVGLGNVDNTADANKSVNYATTAGSATTAGNGGVTSVNGSTGAVTVSVPNVATTTAGLSTGAVGSYAFLWTSYENGGAAGGTVAGSSLAYTNAYGFTSGSPSGTWRRMGYVFNIPDYASAAYASLYLRIS
jgi:hypothetical protein